MGALGFQEKIAKGALILSFIVFLSTSYLKICLSYFLIPTPTPTCASTVLIFVKNSRSKNKTFIDYNLPFSLIFFQAVLSAIILVSLLGIFVQFRDFVRFARRSMSEAFVWMATFVWYYY
jgi:hypothetical protein